MKSFMILIVLIYVIGRVSSLNAKAWQSVNGDLESNDFPETPYLLTRSNTAIGFSGGGETPVDSLKIFMLSTVELGQSLRLQKALKGNSEIQSSQLLKATDKFHHFDDDIRFKGIRGSSWSNIRFERVRPA